MFPGEFIPLFETNGFITKLDHFVYIEMLEFISHAVERGETVVPVSVNVSRVTATQDDFINFYVSNKKKYRIPDGFITLELTESFAMEDYDKMQSMIEQLHTAGMQCSIDDFGSGYSSLASLNMLPLDILKLDGSMIRQATKLGDFRIIESAIQIAQFLGLETVVEGVETAEELDRLRGMGCDLIQGIYYSWPLEQSEFEAYLARQGA
jgi:EAL domain-containing protein (putative c-di-GMP-specific phosphodiesterase class I)